MNLIIAGSRSFSDYELLKSEVSKFLSALNDQFPTIISGTAAGADKLGERYAKEHGLRVVLMPANWNLYGKSAGYKRNQEMAAIAHACIVFWNGKSPGTNHMRVIAKAAGIKLKTVMI